MHYHPKTQKSPCAQISAKKSQFYTTKKATPTKPKIIQKHQSIFIAMNNQNHINIRPKPWKSIKNYLCLRKNTNQINHTIGVNRTNKANPRKTLYWCWFIINPLEQAHYNNKYRHTQARTIYMSKTQLLAVILCIVAVEYASTTPCSYIMYSCCRMSLGE